MVAIISIATDQTPSQSPLFGTSASAPSAEIGPGAVRWSSCAILLRALAGMPDRRVRRVG